MLRVIPQWNLKLRHNCPGIVQMLNSIPQSWYPKPSTVCFLNFNALQSRMLYSIINQKLVRDSFFFRLLIENEIYLSWNGT